MSDLNRREFVQLTTRAALLAAAAAGACSLCSQPAGAAEAQSPSPGELPAKLVDIGTPADYPGDGVFDKFIRSDQVIVVRHGDRIYALSAVCTHKAKIVHLKSGVLTCPAHGSRFDNDGKPIKGPARAALFHLGISQNEQKHLIVDKSRKFGERESDNPQASFKIA